MIADVLCFAARMVSGASVRWAGPPPTAAPRVYFANHSSHFDFLVVASALPRKHRKNTRAVAARDYWEGGRLRRLFANRIFNVLLIDRKPVPGRPGAIEVMGEALRAGQSLILFPEGTRAGAGPGEGRFKNGIYQLAAAHPDAEFVPVSITNMRRILPKGEFLPVPLLSRVTVGAPLERVPGEGRPEFLARAERAVAELAEG